MQPKKQEEKEEEEEEATDDFWGHVLIVCSTTGMRQSARWNIFWTLEQYSIRPAKQFRSVNSKVSRFPLRNFWRHCMAQTGLILKRALQLKSQC